jgi:hypothetical protein
LRTQGNPVRASRQNDSANAKGNGRILYTLALTRVFAVNSVLRRLELPLLNQTERALASEFLNAASRSGRKRRTPWKEACSLRRIAELERRSLFAPTVARNSAPAASLMVSKKFAILAIQRASRPPSSNTRNCRQGLCAVNSRRTKPATPLGLARKLQKIHL